MMPREDFLKNLRGKPDLYGPFWVAVTLCFSTAICGNLANFVQNKGDPAYVYAPEFERVTSAASAIFGYVFVFPMFLSVVMYYSKIMTGFSAVELLTAYGYSLSIFIPISFFWIIPVEFIRWLLVIFASVVSGAVVGLPIYNGLKAVTNKQKAYAVLALAVVANLGLSVGFKMYFFEAPLNPSGFVPPVQPPVEIQQQPVVPENPVELEEVAPIVDEAPAVEHPVVPEVPEPVEPAQAVESVEENKEVAEPELVAQEQVQEAPEAADAAEAPVEAPVVDAEEAAREEHVEEVLHQLPRVASPVQAAAEEAAQVPEVQAPDGAEAPVEAPAEENHIVLPRVHS